MWNSVEQCDEEWQWDRAGELFWQTATVTSPQSVAVVIDTSLSSHRQHTCKYKCASHRQQRAFSVESPVILTNYCQSQPSQVIIGTVTATWWSSSFHLHALGAAIIAATWPVTYFCQSSKGTECCLHHICNSDGQWEICQSTTSVHCGQTNPAVLYCAIFLTSNSWSLCCAAISICFFNGMPDAHFVEPSWLFGDSDVISNSFLIFSANQGCDLQWEGPPLRGESPTS